MLDAELNIIKQAITNEIEGYEFYNIASEKAVSEESKQAFKDLADEEFQHVNWLKSLYVDVKDGRDNTFDLVFLMDPPSPKIFNWSNVDRKTASLAVSVFGIGIQMEKSAVNFYTNAYNTSEIKTAKELYKNLIEWEKSHLEQFSKEYEILKEQWWSDQEFSPF